MESTTTTTPAPEAPKLTPEMLKQKAAEIFTDLLRYASEHRELSRKNFEDFRAKHKGLVGDVKASVQKALPKEEVQARVREVNDLVEKRLETIRSDVEKRYDELEREIQETVERVFGHKVEATAGVEVAASGAANGAATVASPPTTDAAAEAAAGASKKRRPVANN